MWFLLLIIVKARKALPNSRLSLYLHTQFCDNRWVSIEGVHVVLRGLNTVYISITHKSPQVQLVSSNSSPSLQSKQTYTATVAAPLVLILLFHFFPSDLPSFLSSPLSFICWQLLKRKCGALLPPCGMDW